MDLIIIKWAVLTAIAYIFPGYNADYYSQMRLSGVRVNHSKVNSETVNSTPNIIN